MPRDGSNVYHVPVGTQAVTNTTIGSTPYNAFLGDLETDLNAARPIVAGGTGATSASAARIALGAEASTQVVTNYDTFAFEAGSFYSAPGATSAPEATGHYLGFCTLSPGGSRFLEARNYFTQVNYLRQYTSSWGPWIPLGTGATADLDAAYVNVAGDTMTGPLTVTGSLTANGNIAIGGSVTTVLSFNPTSGAASGTIFYQNANTFVFAGAGNMMVVNLAAGSESFAFTGNGSFTGSLNAPGGINVGAAGITANGSYYAIASGSPTTGIYYFGNTGTKYLNYDGTNFNLVGGPLVATAPTPASNDNSTSLATTAFVKGLAPRGYLGGLTMSTPGGSGILTIQPGAAMNSANSEAMTLASVFTKNGNAWVVGSGNGALDTGTIGNNWYHIYLIKRPDTGVVDICYSLSGVNPLLGVTIPAAYNQYRRIGAIRYVGGTVVKFIQNGDDFTWDAPAIDVSAANPGTAAVLRALSVPSGIVVEAKLFVIGTGASGDPGPGAIYISDPAIADTAPSAGVASTINVYTPNTGALTGQIGAPARVFTNVSTQVRSRIQISNANITLGIHTHGWIDRRGRDA